MQKLVLLSLGIFWDYLYSLLFIFFAAHADLYAFLLRPNTGLLSHSIDSMPKCPFERRTKNSFICLAPWVHAGNSKYLCELFHNSSFLYILTLVGKILKTMWKLKNILQRLRHNLTCIPEYSHTIAWISATITILLILYIAILGTVQSSNDKNHTMEGSRRRQAGDTGPGEARTRLHVLVCLCEGEKERQKQKKKQQHKCEVSVCAQVQES